MTVLSPFVYWAQSESNVFIKVDLKDAKEPKVNIEKRKLQFEAKGVGAKGLHNYTFSIDFNNDIEPEEANYKVLDNKIDFTITKKEKVWWSRLTSQPQKPAWLKIDFDRWQPEEDINDDDEKRNILEDYPDLYQRLQKEEFGYRKEDIKKVYLIIYNLFMYVGYLYICVVLAIRFLRDGLDSFPGTYESVGPAMCFLQLISILEIMHPIFGYTNTSVMSAFLQVMGRNFVLFALVEAEPRIQTKPVIFYLFLTWSAVEIIRYPYYITQLYKKNNSLLTWLRYSVWIALYPIGFVCEAVITLTSIMYAEDTGRFTVSLPNYLNFAFHFPTALRVYMLIFMIPSMYALLAHMYRVRRKKLGPKPKKWIKTN